MLHFFTHPFTTPKIFWTFFDDLAVFLLFALAVGLVVGVLWIGSIVESARRRLGRR